MPNKFFTQTPGTPGQLGQDQSSSFFEYLRKEAEKKKQQNETAIQGLTDIVTADNKPETFIDIKQGQTVVNQILSEITRQSLNNDVDPAVVVEEQLKSESIGKRMLRDFMLGTSAAVGGQVENTRSLLMKKELAKKELREKQISAMEDMFKSFTQMDNSIRAANSQNMATRERAAEALKDTTAADAMIEVNKQKSVEVFKREQQQKLEAFKNANKLPTNLDNVIAPLAQAVVDKQADPDATMEEREAAKAKLDTAMEVVTMMKKAEEAGKPKPITGGGASEGMKDSWKTVERDFGTYGDVSVVEHSGINPTTGLPDIQYITPSVPVIKSLSPEWQKTLDMAVQMKPRLTELGESFARIPNKNVAVLVEKLENYQSMILAVKDLVAGDEDAGRKHVEAMNAEIKKLKLTPSERNFIQQYNALVAATVRAFTGAQATDAERRFIQSTLPASLGDSVAFATGIEKMRLATEWQEYKIRNNLHAPDGSFADAGEFFATTLDEWQKQAAQMKKTKAGWLLGGAIPAEVRSLPEFAGMSTAEIVEKWGQMDEQAAKVVFIRSLARQVNPEKIQERIGAVPFSQLRR